MLTKERKSKVEEKFSFYVGLAKKFFHVNSVPNYPVPKIACVYAFEMSDNTVKIGITRDVNKRVKSVQSAVYLEVKRRHQTGFAPLKFMRTIEARCHATFVGRRERGEYFAITFEEAVAELDRYAQDIADALREADENFIDEFSYYEELKTKYFPSSKVVKSIPAGTRFKSFSKTNYCFFDVNEMVCVYIFFMSNGTIKIINSGDLKGHMLDIKEQYGLTVEKFYQTVVMPRKVARAIEKACHEIFFSFRVEGEFFCVDFETACRVLEALEKLVASLPLVSDYERGQKLLEAAKMIDNNSERQTVLITATNLITGKNLD